MTLGTCDILFGPIDERGRKQFAVTFDGDPVLYTGFLIKLGSGHLQVLGCKPYLDTKLANRIYDAYEQYVANRKARKAG